MVPRRPLLLYVVVLFLIVNHVAAWAPAPQLAELRDPRRGAASTARQTALKCQVGTSSGSRPKGLENGDHSRRDAIAIAVGLLGVAVPGLPALAAAAPKKAPKEEQAQYKNTFTKTASGLQLQDVRTGTGPQVEMGSRVTFNYVGRLAGRQGAPCSWNPPDAPPRALSTPPAPQASRSRTRRRTTSPCAWSSGGRASSRASRRGCSGCARAASGASSSPPPSDTRTRR
jgi:hypothetical protein